MFVTEIKVRGYHIDVFGHVNNARYLEFLEEARWRFLDNTMIYDILKTNNLGFAVVNININYRKAAFQNDILMIEVFVEEVKNTSMIFKQRLINKITNELIADATVTFVILDLERHRATRISNEIRDEMLKFN